MTAEAQATAQELCREFLKPLVPFLDDKTVSTVMVNGADRVYVEREGVKERVECAISEEQLRQAAQQIAILVCKSDISDAEPILDARLVDGSRLAVVLGPVSVGGTALTIRKFQMHHFRMIDLVKRRALPETAASELVFNVKDRKNILVSGGTGSGKTTFMNALADTIPKEERLCLIEDTSELQLQDRNLIRLEARKAQEGLPEITLRDLLKASLRQQPDRILLGEVRGGEAFEFLQAMNTGHDGTISTIHASSASLALARLASCTRLADVQLDWDVIQSQIACSLNYVVQLHKDRKTGHRKVTEIISIDEFKRGRILTTRIYPAQPR